MPEPIGVAFVEVVPETTAFTALLQRQVTSSLAQTRANVPVGNVGAATARLEALAAAEAQVTQGAIAEGAAAEEASAALTTKAAAEERASFFTRLHTKSSREAAEAVLAETSSVTGLRGASIGVNPAFLAATAATIAFFKAGEEADQFAERMHLIQFATEATDKQMQQASATAKAYGRDLSLPGVSALDAVDAIERLTHSGFDLADSEQLARDTLLLHSAAQIDLGESTDTVTRLLRAYHLEVDQASQVTDTLTAATLSGAGSTQEWSSALQTLAPLANSFGFTIQDTATLLIQYAHAGVSASQATTLTRLALARLASNTEPVQKGLKQIGLTIDDIRTAQGGLRPDLFLVLGNAMRDATTAQQGQAAAAIFGARAGARLLPILQQTAREYRNASERAHEAGLTQKEAEDRTKSLGGQTKELRSDLSDLGVATGRVAKGPLTLFVGVLRVMIDQQLLVIAGAEKLGRALASIKGPSGIDLGKGLFSFLGGLTHTDEAIAKWIGHTEEMPPAAQHASDAMDVEAKVAHGLAVSLLEAADASDKANRSFQATGDTQLAILQATGAPIEQQLEQARRNRQLALQRLARDRARLAQDPETFGTRAAGQARLAADAQAVSTARAAVNQLLGQEASTSQKQAAAAEAAASKITEARNRHDQAVLSSIGQIESRKQAAVQAAAVDETLRNDIAAEKALRNFYNRAIARVRREITDAKTRAAEIQRLRLSANEAAREITRLQKDRTQQIKDAREASRATAVEAAQLDEQILEARFGDDPSSAQINKLTAAHRRIIAALKRAQALVRRGSVEWKRLQLEIEQERAAIRELRKSRDDGQKDVLALQQQEFAFLQTIHGFDANLISNLIPGGFTSGLVGGTATTQPSGTSQDLATSGVFNLPRTAAEHGRGVPLGQPQTRATAGVRDRPVSAGQGNTQITLLREIRNLLRHRGLATDHPEVHHQRAKGAAALDYAYEHGGHGM